MASTRRSIEAVSDTLGAMDKPFEVDIDCGGSALVRFTLDEERIRDAAKVRGAGGLRVRAAIGDDVGDPDERTRLWRGALTIAREVIRRSEQGIIEVLDGPDVWIIPEKSVRWVRLHDPESPDTRRTEIGFHIGGQQDEQWPRPVALPDPE